LRGRRKRKIGQYPVVADKLGANGDDFFRADPVRLIELFVVADREWLEVHPEAMRLARRDSALIDAAVRKDPRANRLFLELLTQPPQPRRCAALDERGRGFWPLRA